MKPIYVIGHKNPDLDSIAAAISYKFYKQSTDEGIYIAAAAGEMSEEILFVLEKFNFEPPMIIKNVSTKADDLLETNEIIYAKIDMKVMEIANVMRKHDIKTIPVLDEHHKFLGLLTIGDLAKIFMDNLGQGRNLDKSPEIIANILNLRVEDIMKTRELNLFEKNDTVEEVRKHMLATRFRNYPVVDEENRYLGMISRYNLLDMRRKKVILVDHNEKKQAVEGIEQAEVLEIIDHHRVGDIQTISPIYFKNEPVGSTCTLIAEMFIDKKMYINQDLAGLMLSGLLSDTMIFKSPTTTAKDLRIAEQLSELSGLDPVEWGKEMFDNSSLLDKQSDLELVSQDLKEYTSQGTTFAISQIETVDIYRITERKKGLKETMESICKRNGYAFMCLMVTDIIEEGTQLIVSGEKRLLVKEAFTSSKSGEAIFLKGVMSRKKQVVPVLFEVLRKEGAGLTN
ncbi:MAG TPA: putative manganese-dependent inorganic diphosphatase [Syntrophomonadaceae bacterium]|nr:putative manganese-dependent inorganic diphosphatase [Syntrophomonadaceae bacterium]